jgi:hypothetical protein
MEKAGLQVALDVQGISTEISWCCAALYEPVLWLGEAVHTTQIYTHDILDGQHIRP